MTVDAPQVPWALRLAVFRQRPGLIGLRRPRRHRLERQTRVPGYPMTTRSRASSAPSLAPLPANVTV